MKFLRGDETERISGRGITRPAGNVDMTLLEGIVDLGDRADEGTFPGIAEVEADGVEDVTEVTGRRDEHDGRNIAGTSLGFKEAKEFLPDRAGTVIEIVLIGDG